MDSDLSILPTDQCIIPEFQQEDTPLCTVIHHPSVEEFNLEVIVHPDVGQYGYLWHPGLRMLVCLHCKTMVAPHRLRYHCNQAKHQAPDPAVVKTILALVDLRYKKYLPNVTSGQKLRPIKGLDTEDSRQCTVCPYISNVDGTMKNHIRTAHNGKWDPTLFRAIRCQTFTTAPMTRFAVEDQSSTIGDFGAVTRMLEDRAVNIVQAIGTTSTGVVRLSDAWPYLKKVAWDSLVGLNRNTLSLDELYRLGHLAKTDSEEAKRDSKIHEAVSVFFGNMEGSLEVGCWELRQMVLADQRG